MQSEIVTQRCLRSCVPSLETSHMRIHRPVFFFLTLVGLLLIPGVAFGQQAASPSSANSGKTAVENGPSPATAQKAAPLSPFETAMILYRSREFAGAAAALDQISQSGDADSAKAFAWLARTDLRMGKIAEAEAAAQKALAISANLPTGHAALGEVYFRQGKFADAEKEFLTPLKAGVADPRAYLGEGRLSWASSNQIHGKKLIDKAHALDPQDPEIRAWWLSTLSRSERVAYLANEVHPGNSSDPGHSPSPKGAPNESANNPPPEANCHLIAPGTTSGISSRRSDVQGGCHQGLCPQRKAEWQSFETPTGYWGERYHGQFPACRTRWRAPHRRYAAGWFWG